MMAWTIVLSGLLSSAIPIQTYTAQTGHVSLELFLNEGARGSHKVPTDGRHTHLLAR